MLRPLPWAHALDVVSNRRRKKEAKKQGLTEPELRLVELVEEILDKFRWQQVLVHAQSFLLRDKLKISDAELNKLLEAASRAVDKDAAWTGWQERLGRLKGEVLEARRSIRRERKQILREAGG